MSQRTLSLREINRATLQRQMLFERETVSIPAAIERLVGLQAQYPMPPYIGLWTRLRDFRRADLAQIIENRTVLRATLLRATLHMCTAEDYLRFRTTLQPVLAQASQTISKQRGADFDLNTLLAKTQPFLQEKPRTFAEISAMLAEAMPGMDVGAMRYAVRTHLALAQVPAPGKWSYPGNPEFTLAEEWIGRPVDPEDRLGELVRRYLAAFGPASAADMQTWSGLAKLKDVFEMLKPELRVYQDEKGRELYDLPDQALPGGDAPVPARFLPEYDNLLLSHSQRTRVIADEYRARVYLPGLRVRATILVDGFVRGAWRIEKTKQAAALIIEPFAPLSAQDQSALVEEGEQLVRFVEPEASSFAVRFAEEED